MSALGGEKCPSLHAPAFAHSNEAAGALAMYFSVGCAPFVSQFETVALFTPSCGATCRWSSFSVSRLPTVITRNWPMKISSAATELSGLLLLRRPALPLCRRDPFAR